MYNAQTTAEKIKSLAKTQKIIIKDMLAACNLSKNALSSMQSRGSWLQANNLAKIADYLGCSVDYLLGRDANQSINTGDINDNRGVIGQGNVINGSVRSEDASGLAAELMKVFNNLPVKSQIKVMQFVYELEEKDG